MYIYGGALKGGQLAPDIVYYLDINNGFNQCSWNILSTTGISPGKRYGHSMAFISPNLFVFGGNIGSKLTNDIHVINVEDSKNNEWIRLEPNSDLPQPRMYHSFNTCKFGTAKGMMIVFGGRAENGSALNDIWGFRRHRDGRWDWTKAPYQNFEPTKRFQHTAAFYYKFLIILGGRTDDEAKDIPIQLYDTDTSRWSQLSYFNKFRHSTFLVNSTLYSHGGFDHSAPLISKNDLIAIDLNKLLGADNTLRKELENIEKDIQLRIEANSNNSNTSFSNINRSGSTTPNLSMSPTNYNTRVNFIENHKLKNSNQNLINNNILNNNYTLNNKKIDIIIKEGELSTSNINEGGVLIKKVVLNENGKYKIYNDISEEPLCDKFINYLLDPVEWFKKKDLENTKFNFSIEDILLLTNQAIDVVREQPMVLKVTTPVKVFGDVHGQYIDLMTFFYKWGEPKEGPNGDIDCVDYLFLGDYVDRGTMSLETICLLMALKIKYPQSMHLLRGNHEDRIINTNFGFADECQIRLEEDPLEEDSVFNNINLFFEFLPLAAVIEDQIFCLHGGIGSSVRKISDIECIPRPLEVVHEANTHQQQTVMDILWSDPTDYDTELGIQPNTQRDSNNYGNIVKFGPDVVKKFLQDNQLNYILRAHECVLDGFERFAGGMLITVFSATDYCRRHDNAGAMLLIKNNFEISPHLIYPPEGGNQLWMDDEETLKKKPPTPPRIRYNKNNI